MDPINGHTVMCALSARATLSYEKPKWLMGCDICSTNVMIRYLGKHQERKTISAHILRSWSKKIWGIFILFNKHIFWQLFRTLLFHLFLQIPQQKVLCAAPLFPKGQPKRIDLHIWFGTDFTLDALPDAALPLIQALCTHEEYTSLRPLKAGICVSSWSRSRSHFACAANVQIHRFTSWKTFKVFHRL